MSAPSTVGHRTVRLFPTGGSLRALSQQNTHSRSNWSTTRTENALCSPPMTARHCLPKRHHPALPTFGSPFLPSPHCLTGNRPTIQQCNYEYAPPATPVFWPIQAFSITSCSLHPTAKSMNYSTTHLALSPPFRQLSESLADCALSRHQLKLVDPLPARTVGQLATTPNGVLYDQYKSVHGSPPRATCIQSLAATRQTLVDQLTPYKPDNPPLLYAADIDARIRQNTSTDDDTDMSSTAEQTGPQSPLDPATVLSAWARDQPQPGTTLQECAARRISSVSTGQFPLSRRQCSLRYTK